MREYSSRDENNASFKENTILMDDEFPFNIFKVKSVSDQILHVHWHEHIEIIYMLEGEAVFNIGNESSPSAKGDILFINKGCFHSGYSINNSTVEYYAIVFNAVLLKRWVYDTFSEKFIFPFIDGQILLPAKVLRDTLFYKSLQGILTNLVLEFEQRETGFEIYIKAYLSMLFTSIFRYAGPQIQEVEKRRTHNINVERFRKLFLYLEENFYKRILVKEAADIVNMSTYHFCKTFKKVTGKTFIEFLNLFRVNEAEKLLGNTNMSVTEVAEQVGFCNTNYFDKVFKQVKGYPPSQCRKNAQLLNIYR